ncbi:MAG: hypothetical protein AAF414_13720 [Pseudomonadota bacterium]
MIGRFLTATLASSIIFGSAAATEIPDLLGTWQVSAIGVRIQTDSGDSEHNVNHFDPLTGSYTLELVVTIDQQDGVTFSGVKASSRAEEIVAGVIDFDGDGATIIDHDGTTTCTLVTPDEMQCTYIEVNAENSNLNRQVWTRDAD